MTIDQGLKALEAELFEAAKAAIAEANNSLYGSQGFFLSLDGGPPDKYHLARSIEKLKAQANREWRRAEALEAARTPSPSLPSREAIADVAERSIFRRVMDGEIEGYTKDCGEEIADAILSLLPVNGWQTVGPEVWAGTNFETREEKAARLGNGWRDGVEAAAKVCDGFAARAKAAAKRCANHPAQGIAEQDYDRMAEDCEIAANEAECLAEAIRALSADPGEGAS